MADRGRLMNWAPVPYATSYDVELRNSDGTQVLEVNTVDDPAIGLGKLFGRRDPGLYQVRIRAKRERETGPYSQAFPVTVPGLPAPTEIFFP